MRYGRLNLTNFRGLKLDPAFTVFSHIVARIQILEVRFFCALVFHEYSRRIPAVIYLPCVSLNAAPLAQPVDTKFVVFLYL